MKKLWIILPFIMTAIVPRVQASGPGTSGATFLRIGVGARPEGMGEAFTAASDDINALFWNVAGLGQFSGHKATFMDNLWGPEEALYYLAYAQPVEGMGTLGGSLTYLSMGSLPVTSVASPDGTGES